MKKLLIPIASIALGLFVAGAVQAQAWPSKPVTLVVPFPPGGSSDMIARSIGAKMQDRLDRRVFSAAMRRLTLQPNEPTAVAAQRDLEAIQRLWASPVLLAIFDIPWTPIFVAARITGWCAHIMEQHQNNKLIRPLSQYTGPAVRKWNG